MNSRAPCRCCTGPTAITKLDFDKKHKTKNIKKANLKNLIKALQACAQAHNARFDDWSDEGQLGVWSTTPGTICDVQMICEAFFGTKDPAEVSNSVNCITVWISYDFLPKVNEQLMYMALPHGTKL